MEKDDQNNKKESKFIAYITGKGFYKIIGLCIALVVLAAWFITSVYKNRIGGELTDTSSSASSQETSQNGGVAFESGLSSELFEPSQPTVTENSEPETPTNTQSSDEATAANASAESVETTIETEDMLFIMPVSGEIIRTIPQASRCIRPHFRTGGCTTPWILPARSVHRFVQWLRAR